MGGEKKTLHDPMGYSMRTNYVEATGSEGRGGGDYANAAERVKDLMSADEHGKSGVFAKKEAAAKKAREQWLPEGWDPKKPGYMDASAFVKHERVEPVAHGTNVPKPPEWAADGWVSHPDPNRLPEASEEEGEARALQGAKIEVGMGQGAFTKDWRAESSRIGRYWANPDFKLGGYGTWRMEPSGSPSGGSNPFEMRR